MVISEKAQGTRFAHKPARIMKPGVLKWEVLWPNGWCAGLEILAITSELQCVLGMGKTLYSHSGSLQPGLGSSIGGQRYPQYKSLSNGQTLAKPIELSSG